MTNNKAIELLDNLLGVVEDNHGSDYDKAIHMAIDALKAEDAVEVVRCKDCKHSSPNKVYGCRFEPFNTLENGERMYSDGFCSYGEKKDEEDTDESVIAEWICLGHRSGFLKHPYSIDYKCSNCGYEEYTLLSYPPERCPKCRAYMKGKLGYERAEE